jgi:hypothetical protein
MIRALLLILFVTSSIAFAQTEDYAIKDPLPEPRIFDEFEKATNGFVKMRLQSCYADLNNDPTAQGYIINYGTPKEIAKREKQIRNALSFLKLDAIRITMVNGGGSLEIIKTELWVVPAGAKPPEVKGKKTNEQEETPATVKLQEFQKLTNGYVKIKIHRFFKELNKKPKTQGYIINYGTAKEIAKRNAQIKDAIGFFKYDSSRVTLVKGGNRKVIKTQFWIVPEGAEAPKPKR